MAQGEYRIIVTATWDSQNKRDSAHTSLKSALQAWKNGLIAAAQPKRMDMTKDDYVIPDAPSTTESV